MSKNTVILFYGLFSEEQSFDWAPSGLLYLAAKLKENNFNPVIIHEFIDKEYRNTIEKHKDDILVFGVSSMTGYQITSGIKAVNTLRTIAPEVPILWGGAHATDVPANVLQSKYTEYVNIGPGIEYFVQLAKNLRDNKADEVIPYVYNKNDLDFIIENPPKIKVKDSVYDLSNFPAFPFELLQIEKLLTNNRVINYTTSFGCPNNCTFCSWGGFHLRNALPAGRVIEDITYLTKKYNLKSIWFADATLFYNRDSILEIAEGILKNNLNIYWRGNASYLDMRKFDYDDFALLEKAGCDRIFLGIENTSQAVLKRMNKCIDPDKCTGIFSLAKDFKIQIMASMIFGNPHETLEDLEINGKYVTKWLKINPNFKYQTCFLKPYPGTKEAAELKKMGFNLPNTLEEYATSSCFLDVNRDNIDDNLEWYSKDFAKAYKKRFKELFPKHLESASPDWNWRSNS